MKRSRSRLPATGRISRLTETSLHGPGPDVFAKIRGHERVALMRAARDAGMLPYFHEVESPAMPVVQMDGAPRIMLGSNNYLGLTGDERVMAGRARRPRPLRHRADRLAPAQRHDAAAPRARARARRLHGDRRRDRLHHRPPGERRDDRDAARPGRHRGRRLGRPRLAARRRDPLAGEAARVPPQPPGQAREHAREGGRRRRRRTRRRRRGLLDGGRRRAAARDRRAVRALRRPADGRRGARGRRARRARRRHRRAARRRGPRRPADGHLLEVARVLRRVHRRATPR